MAQTTLKQRIIGNPGRRREARKKKRSSNPGEILGFVLGPAAGNPGRKRGNMAKTKANRGKKRHYAKHHRSNPGHRMNRGHSKHRRRSNPGVMHHHRRHHRRNPGFGGEVGAIFTNAVFVIVGALGSKLGAQAILGTNNVGIMGYAGNAATGAVLWFLADKWLKNKAAASGIIAGTMVQIILRVINDYTPFGSYVANLGMGDYQMQSFVTPQVLVNPWKNANVQIPAGWGPGAAPPMSATAGPRQLKASGAAIAGSTAAAAGAPTPAPSGVGQYGNTYGYSALYN